MPDLVAWSSPCTNRMPLPHDVPHLFGGFIAGLWLHGLSFTAGTLRGLPGIPAIKCCIPLFRIRKPHGTGLKKGLPVRSDVCEAKIFWVLSMQMDRRGQRYIADEWLKSVASPIVHRLLIGKIWH